MKAINNCICWLLWIVLPLPLPGQALPSALQVAWQQAGFGIVFHYDQHVFDGN